LNHTGSSLSVTFTNGAYATNVIVSTVTNNFGIECWVKPTILGRNEVIAYNGITGGIGSGGWGIFLSSNTNYDGLFGGVAFVGGVPATANVWTHLALVRTNGTATLYVNGVAAGSTVTSNPGLPAGNFALATDPQSPGGELFTGLIDEVRVFTFAPGQFSTSDLLYNQTTSVDTTNLLEPNGAVSDRLYQGASSPHPAPPGRMWQTPVGCILPCKAALAAPISISASMRTRALPASAP
jgi:hypothetical protein